MPNAKRFMSLVIAVPALLLVASTVSATPLEEKERWGEMQKQLDEKAERASKACGTKITANYDTASFAGVDLFRAPVQSYCQGSVYALEMVCRTDEGKKALQAQISSVTCELGKSGTKVSVGNKRYTVDIDPTSTSITGKKPGSYTWTSALKEQL